MKNYTYRIIIEKDGDEYHGFVPALQGCHTHGSTIEETRSNLRDAMELYMAHLSSKHEDIPEESGFESFETIGVPVHA